MVEAEKAIRFIDWTRKAGLVKRFHTMETHVLDRVAGHTYGVLNLIYILTYRKPSLNLMCAALMHDNAECLLGDIPTNIKVQYPEIKEAIKRAEDKISKEYDVPKLNIEEGLILKTADILEGMYFSVEEVERGNESLRRAFHVYFKKYFLSLEEKQQIPNVELGMKIVIELMGRMGTDTSILEELKNGL